MWRDHPFSLRNKTTGRAVRGEAWRQQGWGDKIGVGNMGGGGSS